MIQTSPLKFAIAGFNCTYDGDDSYDANKDFFFLHSMKITG